MMVYLYYFIIDSPRHVDTYRTCGINSAGDVDYYSSINVYNSYGKIRSLGTYYNDEYFVSVAYHVNSGGDVDFYSYMDVSYGIISKI